MKHIYKFLSTYEYESLKDLALSIFPTWKYHLQILSIVLSAIAVFFDHLFGFGIALGIAMFVAVFVEIRSGIMASKIQGIDFQSLRFSRCVLKLAFWAVIFYIIHAFEKEYIAREHVFDIVTYAFFKSLFIGAITMFCVEHITSILENYAIINGKPKTEYIDFVKSLWTNFLNFLKSKIA